MIMTSTARPYANAVFDIAVEDQRLDAWSQLLAKAALVAEDPDMHHLLCDPRVPEQLVLDIFFDVLKKELDDKAKKFLQLLMSYERLSCLPSIAVEYHRLLAEHNNMVNAEICSAMELSSEERAELEASLAKRFDAKVAMEYKVDETLLAGAVIRVGDTVIDGSMRGRLQRFSETLLTESYS